jgi:hypothetical protein
LACLGQLHHDHSLAPGGRRDREMRIGRVEDVLAVARALHPASHELGGERPELTFEPFWGKALQLGEVLADATDQAPVQKRHALAGSSPPGVTWPT